MGKEACKEKQVFGLRPIKVRSEAHGDRIQVSISVSYQWIRGHAVVLPQNLGPLLDILPSSNLVLHDDS